MSKEKEPVEDLPPLEALNTTELLEILSGPAGGYLRLKRSIPRERLIHLVRTGERPPPEEYASSMWSRAQLEAWIKKNWELVNSQLPCKGPNRGKCTIYPCSEGRHLECFLSAEKHLL